MATADRTQREAFWECVLRAARRDRDVVVVAADLGAPALDALRTELPEQLVHVGIAEQNAVSLGTGLALAGKNVFVFAIAPFVTLRCLEQIRVGQGIMGVPLTLVGLGVGFGYDDSGPTHHLVEELGIMRAIPGMTVHSVSDAALAAAVARRCCRERRPRYVRLDRQALPDLHRPGERFAEGVVPLRPGGDAAIAATGFMVHTALAVAERLAARGLPVRVIEVHTFPVDEAALLRSLAGVARLVTLEEHVLAGGLGSAVAEIVLDRGIDLRLLRLGVPADKAYGAVFGGRELIHRSCGLDPASVEAAARDHFTSGSSTSR